MAFPEAYKLLWFTSAVLAVFPGFNVGLLSDYKICGDSECESLMSRVQAVRDHRGKDCRFLSFRRGDIIFVYHKLTGKREDLWAGTIDRKFGYFSKDAVEEEQVFATSEKVVETQKSDFICMDEYGYPIYSSHLDNSDDVQESQNQESEPLRTATRTEDVAAESPSTSTVSPPASPQQPEGTAGGDEGHKHSGGTAATSHEETRVTPGAPSEQGGSASSSWLGSSVTGWLGLGNEERPGHSAEEQRTEEREDTNEGAPLTASVTGWLGLGGKGKPEDSASNTEAGKEASITSTMTGWLGFGGEKSPDSALKEQQEGGIIDEESEPKETFRSRRMSLDLEGSQLEEEKEAGTLDWLGTGLSSTLGFGATHKESKQVTEEKETQASSSWLDIGVGDIWGFGKHKSEKEAKSTNTGSKEVEKDTTTGSDNGETSQSREEEADAQRLEEKAELETQPELGDDDTSSSSGMESNKVDVGEYDRFSQAETDAATGQDFSKNITDVSDGHEENNSTVDDHEDTSAPTTSGGIPQDAGGAVSVTDGEGSADAEGADRLRNSTGSEGEKNNREPEGEEMETTGGDDQDDTDPESGQQEAARIQNLVENIDEATAVSKEIGANDDNQEDERTNTERREHPRETPPTDASPTAESAEEGSRGRIQSSASLDSNNEESGPAGSEYNRDPPSLETENFNTSADVSGILAHDAGMVQNEEADAVKGVLQEFGSSPTANASTLSLYENTTEDQTLTQGLPIDSKGHDSRSPESEEGAKQRPLEEEDHNEDEVGERLAEKEDEIQEQVEEFRKKEEEVVKEVEEEQRQDEKQEEQNLEEIAELNMEERQEQGVKQREEMEEVEENKEENTEEEEAMVDVREGDRKDGPDEEKKEDLKEGLLESKEEEEQDEEDESVEEERVGEASEEKVEGRQEMTKEIRVEEKQVEVEKQKQQEDVEDQQNVTEEEKQAAIENVEGEEEKEESLKRDHGEEKPLFDTRKHGGINEPDSDSGDDENTKTVEPKATDAEGEREKEDEGVRCSQKPRHQAPETETNEPGSANDSRIREIQLNEQVSESGTAPVEETGGVGKEGGEVEETSNTSNEANITAGQTAGTEGKKHLAEKNEVLDQDTISQEPEDESETGIKPTDQTNPDTETQRESTSHDNGDEAENQVDGGVGFFRQTTDAKTEESTGPPVGLEANQPQAPEPEPDATTNSSQLPAGDLRPDIPAGTQPHPSSTENPAQTKTLFRLYRNLLTHVDVEELTHWVELFGPNKLQFLDYTLGSSESGPGDPDNDESIVSDIERLLHHHREALAAPHTGKKQEDGQKTKTLVALQKLELMLENVRKAFNTRKSDGNEANLQADAGSTQSKESMKARDSSGAHHTDVRKDERNHGKPGGETEGERGPESHPHAQPGPSPQPEEDGMKKVLDLVHQISKDSVIYAYEARDVLIWITLQVVSALPDELQPGPDLYGMPWEPVIISALVGLVTVLLFTCRCYSSVKSRMYRSKERWMAEQVAQLLEEKCKVLENLSKCQQEYDDLEESLKGSGVLAQTQKTEQLEIKARQVDHGNKELERDLEQLKDQLEQQREHRLEQEKRISGLEETIKTLEDETKDLQSQEEQAQTTLKVYNMNSDRLQKNVEMAGEESTLLQESNAQLRQQAEGWAERVSELEAEIRRCEVAHSGMQQDVANKDERIMSLTDHLLKMKAWDSDLENDESGEGEKKETSNGTAGKPESERDKQGHLQKVQKLIYAAKLNADLKSLDEDKDRVFARLNNEVKAKEDLQESIKEMENEKLSLQSDAEQHSDQVQRLQQKLQIMTEMYQENELKLHRLLTVEERERLQKEEKLNKADKNIALAIEEVNNYRQRAEDMEEELEKTKQSYQTQISAHEKKAHNNWLAARAAERELADFRRENALLRQKLTDTQFKLDNIDKDPYALDSLARPLPFRAERSPYGPSPLGRPASETRPFLSPPTLMDGPPARLSPRMSRGPGEPPAGQGELERSGGPHSDSGSISPTWERDRRGPPPGPPGPTRPPGYIFPEPGGPMYRRPPPGAIGILPPPGSLPPHPRGFPAAGPPGPLHPMDIADGPYRENSTQPSEQQIRESGDRRTPPDADLRMGGPLPPGHPMGPMDGPFPRRSPYGPPPPDFYQTRGPGGPPMRPMWNPPPSGMMFPPRFPPSGPPLSNAPHPHYAPSMRPAAPDGLPPPQMGPSPPQQSLPSPPLSGQSPEEHTTSPKDAI